MATPQKQTVRQSFTTTMDDMRHELGPVESFASRLIHAPIITEVSALLAATIVRPRSLIIGGVTAIIALAVSLMLAHFYGYSVSGSESLLGFGVGWLIGVAYDGVLYFTRRYRR